MQNDMSPEKRKIVIDRLDSVLAAVRYQNSGADTHTVGNLRNTATLLKQQLQDDPDCMDEDLVDQMLKNTEARLVQFYKDKYPSSKCPK
jgi:hypothetical protein